MAKKIKRYDDGGSVDYGDLSSIQPGEFDPTVGGGSDIYNSDPYSSTDFGLNGGEIVPSSVGASSYGSDPVKLNAVGSLLKSGATGLSSLVKSLGLTDPQVQKLLGLAGGLAGTAGSAKRAGANTPGFNPPPMFGSSPQAGANGVQSPYAFKNAQQIALQAQTPAKSAASYYTYGQGPENKFFTGTQPQTPVQGHAAGGAIDAQSMGQPVANQPNHADYMAMVQKMVPQVRAAMASPGGISGHPMGGLIQSAISHFGNQSPQLAATLSQHINGQAPQNPPGQPQGAPAQTPAPQLQMGQMPLQGQQQPSNYAPQPQQPPAGPQMSVPPQQAQPMGQQPPRNAMAAGGKAPRGALTSAMASRHISGPGDGTSDSIPARLANGEYVLSADVVSSLGNGANDAGAKSLDAFVKNIRTHKAAGMAKGKLPANAKPIHSYLKGAK